MKLFSNDSNALFIYDENLIICNGVPKIITIITNIPIKSQDMVLNLYKYKNLPFRYNKFKGTLKNPPQFLMIDRNNMLFRTLSYKEFQQCKKIPKNRFYACKFYNIYSKNVRKSCLSKIYMGDMSLISEFFSFVLDVAEEIVSQLSPTKFPIQPLDDLLTIRGDHGSVSGNSGNSTQLY